MVTSTISPDNPPRTTMTRGQLAGMIDHTLLRPEATTADVVALCADAVRLEVCAVCVSPSLVSAAVRSLVDSPVRVATVIGFPSGAHRREVKAAEAARAAVDGVDEADMVIDLGLALSGEWDAVENQIAAVRAVLTGGQRLKVILETALLDDDQIVSACLAAQAAGADFVKTSTGFHPAGGATPHAVRVMADAVGRRLGVKAAGGIHSLHSALAMIDAGATRLGMSATASVLTEFDTAESGGQ
jgi:deoxyribose-phosphate aldolase